MKYLVSYDLRTPGKDYSGVQEAIKNASNGTWCKPLESTYIIWTDLTTEAVYNKISPCLDTSDRILIIEITKNAYWCLDKDISDFLVENL